VYVGNLPEDIRAEEIAGIFDKHGRIVDITVKLPRARGPAFAFIEYDEPRGAECERRTPRPRRSVQGRPDGADVFSWAVASPAPRRAGAF